MRSTIRYLLRGQAIGCRKWIERLVHRWQGGAKQAAGGVLLALMRQDAGQFGASDGQIDRQPGSRVQPLQHLALGALGGRPVAEPAGERRVGPCCMGKDRMPGGASGGHA